MPDAAYIMFTVLDVGQGSGNFIEMYDRNDKLIATALLDLGSERAKKEAGGPSIAYIVGRLSSMSGGARIDFIGLSHSDSDHINLLQELLGHFDAEGHPSFPEKPILKIGNVAFGGPERKYRKRSNENLINQIRRYQVSPFVLYSLPANASTFNNSFDPVNVAGVKFHLLVGNCMSLTDTPIDSPQDKWRTASFYLNTYSLIFVVGFGDQEFVVTGDATGTTLAFANLVITNNDLKFSNTWLLTMPHHASRTTTLCLRGLGRTKLVAEDNLNQFARSIHAKSIHSSAENVSRFKHPSAFIMQFFGHYVEKDITYNVGEQPSNRHYYNAYFDTSDGFTFNNRRNIKTPLVTQNNWRTCETKFGIFTNRYFVRQDIFNLGSNLTAQIPPDPGSIVDTPSDPPFPPFAVTWLYQVNAAGDKAELYRIDNRQNVIDVLAGPPHFRLLRSSETARDDLSPPVKEASDPTARSPDPIGRLLGMTQDGSSRPTSRRRGPRRARLLA